MNNKIIFVAIILLIAILGTTLLTAQTSRIPTPREVTGTVLNKRPLEYDKGKYGGVFINYIVSEPKTFNESQSTDGTSSEFIERTAPYLFKLNLDFGTWEVFLGDHKKGHTGPGYDIDVLSDSMVVTIYLRKDIYWTDGTRMTADDWVFYHNEIVCNEDIGHMGYAGTWVELKNGDEVQIIAEKINRWSFKMIFARTAGEPELASNYNIMPRHILKPVLDSQGEDGVIELWGIDIPVNELVGYGAWSMDKYQPGEGITMKRNDRYFFKDEWNNRLPYLDKMIFTNVTDTQTALLKFRNHEIDALTEIPSNDFKNIVEEAESGDYLVWNGGVDLGMRFVVFNMNPNAERMKGTPQLSWFTKKEFRQAMSFLIDREAMVLQAFKGLAEPDKSFISPASHYYDPAVQFNTEYNPTKAIKLLGKIDIRDRNGDGTLEDKDNVDIIFELLTNTGYQGKVDCINLIAREFNAYGIKCTPVALDFTVVVERLSQTYDWEAQLLVFGGGLFPLSSNIFPSDGNYHMWNPLQEEPATEWEAQIDYLHNEITYEPDFETRKELVKEMHSILYDEMPLILIYRPYKFAAVYNKWGNVYWDNYVNEIGDDYFQRLFLKQQD